MMIGLKEFYQLVENKNVRPQKLMGYIISIQVFLSTYIYFIDQSVFQLLLGLILFSLFIVFVLELFRDQDISFNNIGATLMSVLYVAMPL